MRGFRKEVGVVGDDVVREAEEEVDVEVALASARVSRMLSGVMERSRSKGSKTKVVSRL